MKISQMKAFHELMLTGSVSAAARNLNRSQPAVSALISGLEDELGMKLFERRNGRLHPVPESFYLQEECSELLGRVSTLQKNIQGIKALNSGKIEIVTMPGPSVFLLPKLIADFTVDKSNVTTEMISRSSEIVFQLVAAQQYDLGVADHFQGRARNTSLLKERIFRFDCMCALHRDDPFAKKECISPGDLDNKPLATLYSDHELFGNVERIFRDSKMSLNVKFTTQYFIPLLTFVERNLAYAIVDPIAAESYRLYKGEGGSLVFRPFIPAASYSISVLTPAYRPASLLTRSLTEKLIEEMQRLGGKLIA